MFLSPNKRRLLEELLHRLRQGDTVEQALTTAWGSPDAHTTRWVAECGVNLDNPQHVVRDQIKALLALSLVGKGIDQELDMAAEMRRTLEASERRVAAHIEELLAIRDQLAKLAEG